MKQLLLRVPDELHARLAAQARAKGTSVNALATDILGLGIDPANLTRTDRLRLKLMEIGEIRGTGKLPPPPSPELLATLEAIRAAEHSDDVDDIDWHRGKDRWP